LNRLFGTDGIRGRANQYPLDCETAIKVGRAVATYFHDDTTDSGRFLIGQDTRISGSMLAGAVAAGICSMGKHAYFAGVIPTPGVAYLVAKDGFDAGIVISASHNPYLDNGIKLFNGDGYKLSDESERTIEKLIQDDRSLSKKSHLIETVGQIYHLGDARDRYGRFLQTCYDAPSGKSMNGMSLVIDASNGSASQIAPQLFTALGARVKALFCAPDGININHNCGSQHPQALAERVVAENADVGLALDGDADRLIAVDEKGAILTGDQLLAICARDMLAKGQLGNPLVVTTVMSNMGLGVALKDMGIAHIKTGVGDRYVMQAMRKSKAILGGEDSGHMIFMNHHTTGDGMLAAIKLIEAAQSSAKPLSQLATVMTVFPQCLINVDVQSKPAIDTIDAITREIASVEAALGDRGRVLVRYSGTQPQCRVMVEGPHEKQTRALCQRIADVVAEQLGS
jgi:phosphoglucosamine mutase